MSTTENQTARERREEPPLVQGLIMDGIEHGGSAAAQRPFAQSNQRVLIWCWGLGAVGLFVFVLVGSIVVAFGDRSAPGLFGGFMLR